MTEQEIEELKKENILLRLRNERLEADILKFQDIVKSILVGEITTELLNEELVAEEAANGEADIDAYTDNSRTNETPA